MNVLMIMSDEHSYAAMGFAGNRRVKTPNPDKLAAAGASFDRVRVSVLS